MKRVALYCRVALLCQQTCDDQLRDLRQCCRTRGWADVREFADEGISGTREHRPALDKLLAEVKSGRVDVVMVATLDRLGRSLRHVVEVLELFRDLGVEFISLADDGLLGGVR